MRNKFWIPCSLLLLALAACQVRTSQASPAATNTPIVWPTPTYRIFRTLAPDNASTPTPTPTARPLRQIPQGLIAFQSDRSGSLDIYVMNADGSVTSRLTTDPAVEVFPSWSPDGSRIAFTSDRDGNPDIFTINADGTDMRKIVDHPANDMLPAWSPDGERIAFVSNRDGNDEIYVMNLDGSNLKRLTFDRDDDYSPSWSPDGEWLAYTSTRDVNAEIYKIGADGKNLTRLTDDPAMDANPAWSPDGSRIAFISRRDGFENLFVMDADGENQIQLTEYKSQVAAPGWSPDSRLIAFAADMEGSRDIFIISADGIGLDRITADPGEEFYPAWSPVLPYLAETLSGPTPVPDSVCVNSSEPSYGYSMENPVRIGYDPRTEGVSEENCLPWLLGPQGQPLRVVLLEEIEAQGARLCKVAISYDGQGTADVLYFDTQTFEQPKAPLGYLCGSPVEYLKAITAARY